MPSCVRKQNYMVWISAQNIVAEMKKRGLLCFNLTEIVYLCTAKVQSLVDRWKKGQNRDITPTYFYTITNEIVK